MLRIVLDLIQALFLSNILLNRNAPRNRLYWVQIHPNNKTSLLSVLGGDLHPAAGCGAKVYNDPGLLQKVVFLIELDQLKGCSRSVALLLG